ncbi:ATP/GTP-binding protein [Streptomyces sp. NPDC021354]|uniref:ATP/GTP-binding protein n=1 Tax=Streptomyces sp. NPDC021354 TaxID=3154793 RepID=UPI0033DE23F0
MDDPQGHVEGPHLLRRLAATAAAALLSSALLPAAAYAEDPGNGWCGGTDGWVSVCANDPGDSGSKGSHSQSANKEKSSTGGKRPKIRICTVKRLSPQPPAGSAIWKGHKPGSGAIYTRTCVVDPLNPNLGVVPTQTFWAATPPAATGPDPAQLAQQAVDKMLLAGPDINSPKPAPSAGCGKAARVPDGFGCYTVGVPVWMSAGVSDTTWGPNTATATAGGVTVTATAKVSKVVWAMGDGTKVTCTTRGTRYKASYGRRESPDCGHVYSRTSTDEKGGRFTVTATSTWDIDWNGAGQQGELTETRTSQVQVATTELQVVS